METLSHKYYPYICKFVTLQCISRQGHAITLVGKSAYIFGGSSGSGYGEHVNGNNDPVYLNDLFHLKGKTQNKNNKHKVWISTV